MEIITTFGIIFSLFGLFIAVIEDAEYMDKVFMTAIAGFVILLITWLNVTEVTYEPVEVKETTDFIYYIDHDNNIISLPNNVVEVQKRIPRKGSLDEYTYKINLK